MTVKKFLLITLVILGTLTGGLTQAQLAQASGTTVTTSNNQVILQNDDGTVYLTTETSPSQRTVSLSQTRSGTTSVFGGPLSNINVIIPMGFAKDFGSLINAILTFVMLISALLVFFYLIWGAFDWISSGGDKGKTEAARKKITAAVIGIIIVAASYAIVNLVIRFLGFSSFNDVFQQARTIDGASHSRNTNESELGRLIDATPSATPQ